MVKRAVLVLLGGALLALGWGAGPAHADPYLPHVPGLPGPVGMDFGGPPIIPPGQIQRWVPPPGHIPGPEDFVPNWR